MAVGGANNQVTQLGVEAERGTIVPAVRRLRSMSIELGDEMDIGAVRSRGAKFDSAHPINREWGSGDVSGNGAFNELQYPLAGVLSKPNITQMTEDPDGAGANPPVEVDAWEWLFDTSTFGKDDVQTYTMEQVDIVRNRAVRMAYAMFNAFSIESARSDEVSISGEVVGRNLANQDENGNPIAPTLAGIVQNRIIPMTTSQVNVYMADSPAGLLLAENKLEYNFAYSIEYGGRFNQVWVHDRDLPSWKEHVEAVPSLEMTLTLADDDFADSILADARVGDRQFVRFDVMGPKIGSTGINYRFQWDLACQVSDAPGRDENDDSYVQEISFTAEHDEAWDKATRARLVNGSQAL